MNDNAFDGISQIKSRIDLEAMFGDLDASRRAALSEALDVCLANFEKVYANQKKNSAPFARRPQNSAVKAFAKARRLLNQLSEMEQVFFELHAAAADPGGQSILPIDQMREQLLKYEKVFREAVKWTGEGSRGRNSDLALKFLVTDLYHLHHKFKGKVPRLPGQQISKTCKGCQYGPFTRLVIAAVRSTSCDYSEVTIHNAARKGVRSLRK